MKNTILILSGIIAIITILYIIGSFALIADNEMDLYTTMALFYSIVVGVQVTLVLIFLTKKKNKEVNGSGNIPEHKFCSACGNIALEGNVYCNKCGKQI
ncbi:MAG: hypothetical protein Q8P20_06750 [bacterium]|nr:hypothetical protein [bacterium]